MLSDADRSLPLKGLPRDRLRRRIVQLHLIFRECMPAKAALVWPTLTEFERVEVIRKLAEVLAKTVADAHQAEVATEEADHE